MSFILDRIMYLDAQLDRLQSDKVCPSNIPQSQDIGSRDAEAYDEMYANDSTGVNTLQESIKSISKTMQSSINTCEAREIIQALENVTFRKYDSSHKPDNSKDWESKLVSDLEWYLIGKATIATYGIVLNDLVSRASSVNTSSWYWSRILLSHTSFSIYSIQSFPLRLWQRVISKKNDASQDTNVFQSFLQWFNLLITSIANGGFLRVLGNLVNGDFNVVRAEIICKRGNLKQMKFLNATCIGCLLRFGFEDSSNGETLSNNRYSGITIRSQKWQNTMLRSVAALDVVLETLNSTQLLSDRSGNSSQQSTTWDTSVEQIEKSWFQNRSFKALKVTAVCPSDAAHQLLHMLKTRLPRSQEIHKTSLTSNGVPARLTRYWLPVLSLVVTSSTIVGIYFRRKNAILDWFQDFGSTAVDFWANWIVEPMKKLVHTIRHDEASAISIISRRSLEVDQSSLERMVIDFANDTSKESPLDEMQLTAIRNKIREGDLTPVLTIYEQEVQRPVYGSLRGSLVRALLIQIQKTKVDVEVAMGGIDSLLKSQELLFGIVGLTPGLLVCFAVKRWLGSLFTDRRSGVKHRKASQTFHLLRNIDRILSVTECESNALTFEQYGLLICEAIGVHDIAKETFPEEVFQDFLEDFNELIGGFQPLTRQRRVADRFVKYYWKWL